MAPVTSKSPLSLSTALVLLGIHKSQFYHFAISAIPLIILALIVVFLIKNNGIISIYYKIKSEKNNNISKLLEAIDRIKRNEISATISTQNIFRAAMGITPTLIEIKYIADNINNLRHFMHFKRVYSKLTFDETKKIFLIKKRIFPGFVFDTGYFLFAGLLVFSFILILVAANNIHELFLLSVFSLIITFLFTCFFIFLSGIYSSTSFLVDKKIIQESKKYNFAFSFKNAFKEIFFFVVIILGFLFGIALLWLYLKYVV